MELKGIKLTLDMETSKFESAVNHVITTTKNLDKDISKLKDAFKFDPHDIQAYTQYVSKLQAKFDDLEDVYSALSTLMKQTDVGSDQWKILEGALSKVNKEMGNISFQIEEAQNNFADLNTDVSYSAEYVGDLEHALDELDKELDDNDKSLDDNSEGALELGENFGIAGEGALELSDIIKANLLSDAIKWGFVELISLAKDLANAYIGVVKSGIEYNAEMESFSVSIRAMTEANGEAVEKADELVEAMKAIGSQSAFSNSTLLEASQQLLAADVNADKTTQTIEGLAKALAYTGGGNDELKRMAQNLQQIKNVGKASSVDIKQFAYAGINVYGLLAEQTGKTTEELKEMDIAFDMISEALIKASEEGGKFADTFTVQAGTYKGQLEMLKSNWETLTGVIAQDASNALTQHFLPAFNDTVKAMTEGFKENGWSGLFDALIEKIETLSGDLATAYPQFEPFINGIKDIAKEYKEPLESVIGKITDFIKSEEFQNTLVTVIGWVVSDVSDILAKLTAIGNWFSEGTLGKIVNFFDKVHEAAKSLSDILFSIVNAMEYIIGNKTRIAQDSAGISDSGYSSGGFGALNSSGFGALNSSGFGALQSGGYTGITLNASFNVNGQLDETMAIKFANIMADRVNEELGRLV